jgi:hypothetical protein
LTLLREPKFACAKNGKSSLASDGSGGSPRPERLLSEDVKGAAESEMALEVESVLDGGANGQEALS